MSAIASRPIVLSALCALAVFASRSAAATDSTIPAADNTLPRYQLVPGQELHYTDEGASTRAKSPDSKEHTRSDWKVFVVRTNADGSWRLIVQNKYSRWEGDEEKKGDDSGFASMDACNLFPDGRITFDDSTGFSMASPRGIFPRLPPDADAIKTGWTDVREDGFEHSDFTFDPKHSSGNTWAFDEVDHAKWDKLYGASFQYKCFFDRTRGLVDHSESQFTWGNGFDEKGTSKARLVSSEQHDAAWTKSFAEQADHYLTATAKSSDLWRQASREPKKAEALFAEAKKVLQDARAEIKLSPMAEQLDKQLKDHDQQVKWELDDIKRMAEHKGKPAPDWKLDDLAGKSHSLADYKGKVVLLDFWYKGCGWCMRAMPQVERLSEHFNGKPVIILGMNTDREPKNAQAVVDVFGLTYPVLRAKEETPTEYGVHGFPTMVLIDQKGVVRDYHVGYSKTLQVDLTKKIDELLWTGN